MVQFARPKDDGQYQGMLDIVFDIFNTVNSNYRDAPLRRATVDLPWLTASLFSLMLTKRST